MAGRERLIPVVATFINVALVLLGSALGLLFKNRISPRFSSTLICALGLCVVGIGIANLLRTSDTLCVIICMVVGTLIGEGLKIEMRMDGLGELLRRKLIKSGSDNRFVEGFVTASVLFCVGAMAINGSLEAGIHRDYSILVSKGVIDGVAAITFAAAMGAGVAFSAVTLLLYQGALTIIFSLAGQGMDPAVISGMSAVGGTIIVGIGINMLGLPKEKIRVGNMLPAIFLPILYVPLADWIGRLNI